MYLILNKCFVGITKLFRKCAIAIKFGSSIYKFVAVLFINIVAFLAFSREINSISIESKLQ